jgi:hypothetical protein
MYERPVGPWLPWGAESMDRLPMLPLSWSAILFIDWIVGRV